MASCIMSAFHCALIAALTRANASVASDWASVALAATPAIAPSAATPTPAITSRRNRMLKPMTLPLGTRVGGIGTGADELKVSRPSRPDGATVTLGVTG
ncbi:hypothetical protein Aglo03_32310 [Actinokineospora globicatena]|uniref:Secreted protein n=1 Tax=Actinokineospora globicatena TaxID=103729 RepID=A0A9W6QMH9_9PSEU|nr:hypothetical protein Aglo03_32310 [Actinokineospora globicatena]